MSLRGQRRWTECDDDSLWLESSFVVTTHANTFSSCVGSDDEEKNQGNTLLTTLWQLSPLSWLSMAVMELWTNSLSLEEDDYELERAYYMCCLHPERPVYTGQFSTDDLCESEFLANFRFAKGDTSRLRTGLGIPPVVLLPNSSLVQGMHSYF